MNEAGELIVGLPERVDARARVGPFPSGYDALKFVGYAAVGGILAVALGPVWWLPFLGVGSVITLPPWNGEPPDRRFICYLRWRFRPSAPPADSGPTAESLRSTQRVLEVLPGRFAAIVVADGIPVSFIPLEDRRAIFREYCALLRSIETGSFVTVGIEPLATKPYLPSSCGESPTAAELVARNGYSEMVGLLARRRFRRRVRWLLWGGGSPPELRRLDDQANALEQGLHRLGIRSERLSGTRLAQQLRTVGWALESEKP